jgi:hypothetical protein
LVALPVHTLTALPLKSIYAARYGCTRDTLLLTYAADTPVLLII